MMAWFELLQGWLATVLGDAFANVVVKLLFTVFWLLIGLILHFLVKPLLFRAFRANAAWIKKRPLKKWADKFPKDDGEKTFAILDLEKRGTTLAKALLGIVRFLVWFAVALILLSGYGVNVTVLLASAGVIGIAVAFGTQAIVKDFIAGLLILFEKTFLLGELVTIAGFTGTVKEIGLRTTKLEDWKGAYLIINNGDISSVVNYSRDNSLGIIDVSIGRQADYGKAEAALKAFAADFGMKYPEMVKPIEYLGIADSDQNRATFRFTALCRPAEHFGVERSVRAELLKFAAANGYLLPFAEVRIHREADNDGK